VIIELSELDTLSRSEVRQNQSVHEPHHRSVPAAVWQAID
jgi:hypothetical protein